MLCCFPERLMSDKVIQSNSSHCNSLSRLIVYNHVDIRVVVSVRARVVRLHDKSLFKYVMILTSGTSFTGRSTNR